jgi:flagellar motility protein MotE (MotC chaperone)
MRRNITGLKKSARLRSEHAMDRALAALQRMDASNGDINCRSVAAEAKVSTAWLYRQEELRVRIMRSRKTVSQMAAPASASQLRERQSLQNIVTLRLRIKALEERNRELTEQLERAYGVIAQTQVSSSA